MESELVTIEIEQRAPEDEVAKSARSETDDRHTQLTPAVSEKMDAHLPHETRDPDVHVRKEEKPAAEWIDE